MSFKLNEELTAIDSISEKASMVRAPRDHPFTLQTVGGQTLAVYTETSSGKGLHYSCPGSKSQTRLEQNCFIAEVYMKIKLNGSGNIHARVFVIFLLSVLWDDEHSAEQLPNNDHVFYE